MLGLNLIRRGVCPHLPVVQKRAFASTANPFLMKVLDMLGYNSPEALRIRQAESLFQNVEKAAVDSGIMNALKLEDDFRNTHTMISLHLWLANRRILLETPHDELLQQEIFDIFWEDTIGRVRKLKVKELFVHKQLRTAQGYTFDMQLGLDEAFASEDGLNDQKLGEVLWRSVFREEEGTLDEDVEQLVAYIHRQGDRLAAIDYEEFRWGKFTWET